MTTARHTCKENMQNSKKEKDRHPSFNRITPKKRRHYRYKLYRAQQYLAITSKEIKALSILLSFLFLGVIFTEIQKRTPAFPADIYAETDSLFLQATAALNQREQLLFEDSLAMTSTNRQLSDSLIAFFKPVFPVNINLATQSELEQLPRIGPQMAKRIVTYRTTHGPFQSTAGLMDVRGIGEKTYHQLQDKVVID